jgi:hypothetical protein
MKHTPDFNPDDPSSRHISLGHNLQIRRTLIAAIGVGVLIHGIIDVDNHAQEARVEIMAHQPVNGGYNPLAWLGDAIGKLTTHPGSSDDSRSEQLLPISHSTVYQEAAGK